MTPFRFLESKDFGNDTNQVSYFTKARCVVGVIGVVAFKANKFLIPGSSIEGSPVILRKDIDRALAGKAYGEMNAIFQCGLEQLLKRIVDNSGHGDDTADSPSAFSRLAIQMSYATLYKRLKKYDKLHPIESLCSLVHL